MIALDFVPVLSAVEDKDYLFLDTYSDIQVVSFAVAVVARGFQLIHSVMVYYTEAVAAQAVVHIDQAVAVYLDSFSEVVHVHQDPLVYYYNRN